ncbi:MAG TPA: YbjQ family protein [Pseudomonadales bacterium]
MDALIQLGIFLLLTLTGYVSGRIVEKRHYHSIREREQQLGDVLLLSQRLPPTELLRHHGQLVCGSVVISVDYFKTLAAGLKNLFGGRITAYESLLDRARREAVLRMQEQARTLGADAVINLKFETSQVSGNAGQGIGSVEVLAYGTAMIHR